MPVRGECAIAVEKLIEVTKCLRSECNEQDKEILFIHKPTSGPTSNKPRKISQKTIRKWLKILTKNHNIRDTNNEYYNLTCHQFRRTLWTDMLSKGTDINVIRQVLGHSDAKVTKRFYSDVKDKERAETFKDIGIIENINQLDEAAFDDINEFKWFKTNMDKGACMSDGYCTKPVIDGKICNRLLNRQKCYTCSRYIATPEYLDAHKNHLEVLENQVSSGLIYGKHYAEHFLSTIEVLKIIIERLEELQNDRI